MTNDEQSYNVAKIRELLNSAFMPEGLRRFCQDRPVFSLVVAKFGPGHGLDDMVDEVIEYCRTQLLFDELLAEIEQVNPRQYATLEVHHRLTCLHVDTQQLVASACGFDRVRCANRDAYVSGER